MAKESDARFIMKQEQDSAPISRSLKIGFSLIFVKNMKVPRPIKAPQRLFVFTKSLNARILKWNNSVNLGSLFRSNVEPALFLRLVSVYYSLTQRKIST